MPVLLVMLNPVPRASTLWVMSVNLVARLFPLRSCLGTRLHYIIIQLTPHWGFSVTDYMKYYDYLYYLLNLDYLSLQQLRYYFPNFVYPNASIGTTV
jgi:hypothetical protein